MKEEFEGQKEAMRKGVLLTLDTLFKYGVWKLPVKKETLLHIVDENKLPKDEFHNHMIFNPKQSYLISFQDNQYFVTKVIG